MFLENFAENVNVISAWILVFNVGVAALAVHLISRVTGHHSDVDGPSAPGTR
jgi:hypothetical protein